MCQKTLRKIKKKHKLFKRYLNTKSGRDYERYIQIRNECTKMIKKARKTYEKEIAKSCKDNPKKFWRYVQERLKSKTGIGTLRKEDGSMASDDADKAEVLNKFFSSVYTREDMNNMPNLTECFYSQGQSTSDIRATKEAVQQKLKDLKPDKAQGPDTIPPRVLREVCEEISEPVCRLFNESLETGVIPQDWKTAEVTAIHKKGSKLDPGNYRPVSLTCVLCKVLESIVRDSIVSHFKDFNLYAECQHGFRKHRSCVTQLLETMERITYYFDEGEPIDVIYLDFRKAFDSVPHERLLTKMNAYGICGNILKWTRNFLQGRTQKVRVGDKFSDSAEVLSGIPQGSILGPILFTIFINDMPSSLESMCYIFADDTKILNSCQNRDAIQRDIKNLEEWSDKWNLFFNVSKCHVLHMGNNNPGTDYEMKLGNEFKNI